MKRRNMIVVIAGGLMVLAASLGGLQAQTGENDGPQFQDNTNLLFPHDYREWIFQSSGLGKNCSQDFRRNLLEICLLKSARVVSMTWIRKLTS